MDEPLSPSEVSSVLGGPDEGKRVLPLNRLSSSKTKSAHQRCMALNRRGKSEEQAEICCRIQEGRSECPRGWQRREEAQRLLPSDDLGALLSKGSWNTDLHRFININFTSSKDRAHGLIACQL